MMSGDAQYPLEDFWWSMERRAADICTYFVPFNKAALIVRGLNSELSLTRAGVGHIRLKSGRMPPESEFMWKLQNTLHNNNKSEWEQLPRLALLVLTGNYGPERRDVTGFPRWWLDHPRLLPFGYRAQPFDLPSWVITNAVKMITSSVVEHRADVKAFAADVKSVAEGLGRLQLSTLERGRAIDVGHEDSEEVFLLLHNARQEAATSVQRQHEDAEGRGHAAVPFLAEVPEYSRS
ncbi:unnamed protein product [Peniophora sp. CBMAI 1063]|nr:unnamed protein product [Peniophora sp. CBMAI 1063]